MNHNILKKVILEQIEIIQNAEISNRDYSFEMNVNDLPKNKGIEEMKAASRIASENGISDMSLDEINAEIAAARKQE